MVTSKNRISAQERKTLILEAALKVFADKGFSGARTKKIAQEAGISETLIFHHFGSKKNLYKLALEHLFSHHPILDELQPAMAANDDQKVLYILASHIMEHGIKDERIFRLTLFSGLERMGLAEQENEAVLMLQTYLQRRMDEGAFQEMDARLVARFFIYAVFLHVADTHAHLTGPPLQVSVSQAAETLVDVFMNGLLPRQ